MGDQKRKRVTRTCIKARYSLHLFSDEAGAVEFVLPRKPRAYDPEARDELYSVTPTWARAWTMLTRAGYTEPEIMALLDSLREAVEDRPFGRYANEVELPKPVKVDFEIGTRW